MTLLTRGARRAAAVSLLLLAVAVLAAAKPVEYERYENARYGFSIDYPTFLEPGPESENGDGRRFMGQDVTGFTIMTVWGEANALDRTIADRYADRLAELRAQGLEPAYKTLRNTWYVISWRQGTTLLYEKCVVSRERRQPTELPLQFATMLLSYPNARQKPMDPVIVRVARSFVGPRGE